MLKIIKKTYTVLLKKLDLGSALAVRLTKYTGKSKEFVHPKHFLEKRPWFVKKIKSNDIVLDLGSGNGQNSIKSAKVAKKVIGIELDKRLIKIAINTAKQKHLRNVIFKRGNLEETLKFKNESVDKVIFLDVLEHLVHRGQILSEIHRILKPGGFLMLGVPNKDTSWKKFQRSVRVCSFSDHDHKIEFSESSIRKFLNLYKFTITEFGYGKYDTPFRGLFDVVGAVYLTPYKKFSKWRENKVKLYPKEASGFEIVATK